MEDAQKLYLKTGFSYINGPMGKYRPLFMPLFGCLKVYRKAQCKIKGE